MQLETRAITISTVALAIALAAHAQSNAEGRAQRFTSDKYGFSMAVPRGWGVSTDQDTPLLVSYPASHALPQGRIPSGGANISVVPLDKFRGQERRSLAEWATADATGDSAPNSPIYPFKMPPASMVKDAVISSHDTPTFGPDDQSQHTVNIFWEFRNKRFAAHLLYPAHDPKGPEFERIFMETIRSLRPVKTLNQH